MAPWQLARNTASMSVVAVLVWAFLTAAPALAAPPSNDDSSGAVVVTTLPFAVDLDMTEATPGLDDPPACPGDPSGMATVWYRLEPTFATARWIDVRAASVDTTTRAVTVATPGGAVLGPCDLGSHWILVQPGQTPWVVVQAVVPPGGPATVALQILAASAPPANDRSAGAVVVSSFPFVDDVDVAGATHSANDPTECSGPLIEQGVSPAQTAWYRLDYPYANAHRVGVRVSGPLNNGFWVVDRPGGAVITCADDPTGDGAHGSFVAQPGQRYWIVLGKGTADEHALTEVVRVRIDATQVDDASDPGSARPPDTSTERTDPRADGDGNDPWSPLLPIVAGGLALALLLGRRAAESSRHEPDRRAG